MAKRPLGRPPLFSKSCSPSKSLLKISSSMPTGSKTNSTGGRLISPHVMTTIPLSQSSLSERACEGGAEVTFLIAKNFWPYLEAISEHYCFAGYVERDQYRVLFPTCYLSAPTPEPEAAQAPVKRVSKMPPKKAKARPKRRFRKSGDRLIINRSHYPCGFCG